MLQKCATNCYIYECSFTNIQSTRLKAISNRSVHTQADKSYIYSQAYFTNFKMGVKTDKM